MRNMLSLLCGFLTAGGAIPGLVGAADLFKCTDGAGRVTYQSTPCAGTEKAEAIVSGRRISSAEIAAENAEKQRIKSETAARVKQLQGALTNQERRSMVEECASLARFGVKYPPSYRQSSPAEGVYPVSILNDGRAAVLINYYASNSYGGMVSGQEFCKYRFEHGAWKMDFN